MSIPALSVAKVTRPAVGEILFRERLFQVIDQATGNIIAITGQPGAGKTTLAVSYVEQSSLPGVWLRCDETDADPASFTLHLSEACRTAGVVGEDVLPVLKREHLANLAGFARFYFRTLFSVAEQSFIIVLDDLHALSAGETTQALITTLLQEAPANVQILATSRVETPACLARELVNGNAIALSGQQLQLTPEETAQLLAIKHIAIDAKALHRLHELTSGWAAAIALYSQQSEITETTPCWSARLDQYFASEVLASFNPELRATLLKTAWLPSFTAVMAQELSGCVMSVKAIEQLARNALFVYQHTGKEIHYRYHPLFAGFLQARAEQTLSAPELLALKRRSAQLLEQLGELDAALSLWLDIAATGEATALILRYAKQLASQAQFQTLMRWLDVLPQEVLQNNPWLAYWRGHCALQNNPAAARQYLYAAKDAFAAADDLQGRLRTLSELVSSYFLENANSPAFQELLQEVETLSNDFEQLDDINLQALIASSVWMGICLNRPDYPDRERWERRLQQLLCQPVDPNIKIRIGMVLVKHYYFTGQYHKIWPLRDLLCSDAQNPAVTPYAYLLWHLIEMAAAWTQGDFSTAEAIHKASRVYAERTGVHVLDVFLHSYAVIACLLANKLDAAAQLLDSMDSQLASASPMAVWNVFFLKAWLAAVNNQTQQTLDYGQLALQAAQTMDSVPFQGLARVALCYGELAGNNLTAAADHLAALRALIPRSDSPLLAFQSELIESALQHAKGDESKHLQALQTAFALGREQQFTQFLWVQPEFLACACAAALDANIEPDYVKTLVRQRRLSVQHEASLSPHWLWKYRFFTFGGLRVEINDKTIVFKGKAQLRPLSLLKCLIAFGGHNVHKNLLADTLWPDADGDDAHHALETLTYRLRKLLGDKEVIQVTGGRYSLNRTLCWVDTWSLQEALKMARDSTTDSPPNSIDIVSLYRGPFLADDDEPWLLATRDELQQLFMSYLNQQGHSAGQIEDWENITALRMINDAD